MNQDSFHLEDCLQLLLESSAQGIYAVDALGNCLFFNRAASALTSWRPEEVMHRNIHELIHHSRQDGSPYSKAECPVLNVLRVPKGVRVDDEICWRRDGTSFPVEYSANPIIKEERTIGAVITITDISLRKQTEESLRRHAEGLSFLSSTATQLLGSLNMPDLYRIIADRLYEAAGGAMITFSEFDPRNRRIITRELRCTAAEREVMRRILRRDVEGLTLDFPEETRDIMIPGGLATLEGGIYDLAFRQIPMPLCVALERELNIGGVFAMACVVERNFLGTVAVLTHERGGTLRNKNLVESVVNQSALALKRTRAEKELSIRAAELESFAYTASHDLKTPLVTIRAFLGYLREDIEGQNSESIRKDIHQIDIAATRMGNLLSDLLEISRIGRKVNPPEEVLLQDIINEALRLIKDRIARRGVKFDITDKRYSLFVDHPRMVEVFQNLIDNAVKFMGDQPSPHIEIGAIDQEDEIIFFVRDNGMGIEPKYQKKLFGIFERFHPTIEGAGVGLAIVKRIVEFHNGRIWVESRGHGSGTTFYFTVEKSRSLDG